MAEARRNTFCFTGFILLGLLGSAGGFSWPGADGDPPGWVRVGEKPGGTPGALVTQQNLPKIFSCGGLAKAPAPPGASAVPGPWLCPVLSSFKLLKIPRPGNFTILSFSAASAPATSGDRGIGAASKNKSAFSAPRCAAAQGEARAGWRRSPPRP